MAVDSGGRASFYVDGQLTSKLSTALTFTPNSLNAQVGAFNQGRAQFADGLMKDVAAWSVELTGAQIKSLALSTNLSNSQPPSGKTLTAVGDAKLSASQSVFGGSAALFDGAGDYLTTPATTDFDYGSADFTWDFWVRLKANNKEQAVWSQYTGGECQQ